ncbi:MAG: chromosome segregation protein SMC [Candidatus Methanosuratincola sp.]|jgi:chromosome segregation protein
MRIKSIELQGFKSFYHRTRIELQPAINALVGPNGCGKSNILDSIRWVLGEQNPRLLRAEGMEQVISMGGGSLKPLGMAEVALVLVREGGDGTEEIEVKRRLFRSGESEYFINGITSRLKDITELFMDSGSGARAYSVVDQGKIEQLVSSKPENRRLIVEEVSGIQKYKLRRRETQSRIDTTEENLSRLRDIAGEVRRQMSSLSQQAMKAEEFMALSQQARRLEVGILNYRLGELSVLREETIGRKEALEREIASREEVLEGVLRMHEDLKASLEELGNKIGEATQSLDAVKERIHSLQTFVEVSEREVKGTEDYIKKLESQIELLRDEITEAERELGLKRAEEEALRLELISRENELRQSEMSLGSIGEEIREATLELESIRREIFGIHNQYGRVKTYASSAEKEIADLGLRMERNRREIGVVKEDIERMSQNLGSLSNVLDELRREKTDVLRRKEESSLALARLAEECLQLERELSEVRGSMSLSASRMNALKQIDEAYEWLPEGLGRFLHERKEFGVLGIVSDFVSAPKGYEKALEASLGDKIRWVVVEGEEDALRTIMLYNEQQAGRLTCVPVDSCRDGMQFTDPPLPLLAELVDVDGGMNALIKSLLSGVFVVSSLKEAFSFRKQCGEGARFVTLDGEYMDENGAITGGKFSAQGVFERKRIIRELEEELRVMSGRSNSLSSKIESLRGQISEIEELVRGFEKEIVEKEIREEGLKKDISNLDDNLARQKKRFEILQLDYEQMTFEVEEKKASLSKALEEIAGLDARRALLERAYEELNSRVEGNVVVQKELQAQVTRLSVECARIKEKLSAVVGDIESLASRVATAKGRVERELSDIHKKRARRDELCESVLRSRTQLEGLREEERGKEMLLASLRQKLDELIMKGKSLEKETGDISREVTRLHEACGEASLELRKVELEMERLREAVVDTENAMGEGQDVLPQPLSVINEMGIEGAQAELKRLKSKIERFGAVNLLAPREYRELEERYNFLSAQIKDLEDALSSLNRAIRKIDSESQRRFLEGFELLNRRFKEVFSRLFGGGEAGLVLTDPDNLLESGVDITVVPRGKKLQSINLLSGGEKALSSIALIIAACLIRPAPFLLLDEIDAPLDDTNTLQFVSLLKEIAAFSQVLIVTHNKRTMQAASSLVGITSDIPGVSRVVSVELLDS